MANTLNAVLIDFFLYDLAKERESEGASTSSSPSSKVLPLIAAVPARGACRRSEGALLFLRLLPKARCNYAQEQSRFAGRCMRVKRIADHETAIPSIPHQRVRSVWY